MNGSTYQIKPTNMINRKKIINELLYLLLIVIMIFDNMKLSAQAYPKVEWGTYFGGEGEDFAGDVNIDSKGNITLLSGCAAGAFTTEGVHQASFGGGESDIMISKFDNKGKLLLSTYFGGSGIEFGYTHAVDNDGNIYICGSTTSQSKIAFSNSFQSKYGGGSQDGFLAKLNSEGKMLWSTYFGGADLDDIFGLAIDANNNVYIVGETKSTTGIASDSLVHQFTYGGGTDCFLAKFDTDGKRVWSTYFGGSGYDFGESIKISKSGILYIVGGTGSASKISTPNAYKSNYGGGNDGYISKFSPDGKQLYGSYFGKGAQEFLFTLHLDKDENYFVAGPVISTALSTDGTQNKGKQDVLLSKFDSNDKLLWSTYIGGSEWDTCFGLDTDKDGNPVLAIMSQSSNFPVTENAINESFSFGLWDACFTKFTSGGQLMWSTYFGGNGNDRALDIAIDKDQNMYASVSVQSPGLASQGAQFPDPKGYDSFLLKMKEVNPVSTSELELLEKFTLFPNPVIDIISIPDQNANSNIVIYRNDGTPIRSYLNYTNRKIDVSGLPQGFYHLVIELKGMKKVAQFVKL
jgi:hypothetical protein